MKTKEKFRLMPMLLIFLLVSLSSNSATFTVTNINDAGPGSLRQAMIDANNTVGRDLIHFNISPAGVVHTIQPFTPLPPLTDPTGVTIYGYTQPGAQPNTQPMGSPSDAILLIEIKCIYTPFAYGLRCENGYNIIEGLIINGFASGAGIIIDGSINSIHGQEILGCYIGTNATGTSAVGNMIGVQLINVSGGTGSIKIGDHLIGGRNLISGNQTGIEISGSSGVSVINNYIGLHKNGMSHIGNNTGILINNGSHLNEIGPWAHAGSQGTNVISGNGHGIVITGNGTSSNYILGNYIGLNAAGSAAIGNSASGIRIENGASNNQVGSDYFGQNHRNIISGNGGILGYSGIDIKDAATSGNIIAGNYIGTDPAGQNAIPNTGNGISIFFGSNNNQIGSSLYPSVISGNSKNGIWITDSGSSNNFVMNNLIGLDAGGLASLPNILNGVLIDNGAASNLIGDDAWSNFISGNGLNGIKIDGLGTNSNVIKRNAVGWNTSFSGVPNGANGILISNNAANTQIVEGNVLSFGGNSIAWNQGHGIYIYNAHQTSIISTSIPNYPHNTINNNTGDGIRIENSSNNIISGFNLISNNSGNGISVIGTGSVNNTFSQNQIHNNGGLGIDLGNNGVTLNDSGDPDAGPNMLLNFPENINAVYSYSQNNVFISGTVDIDTNPLHAIVELFRNTTADPSGYGEGEHFIASTTPNALGNWGIITAGQPGDIISGTTIDVSGNTSEFSQCAVVTGIAPPDTDYGDAPEGTLAYPTGNITGQFPTCMNVGLPGSYIKHNIDGLGFGWSLPPADGETDGNAGICPFFNPNMYNNDECILDGDAGLSPIVRAFTIQGNPGSEIVVPCPNSFPPFISFGNPCSMLSWGPTLDIWVRTGLSGGYVNVLIDWDQDGVWGGASICTGGVNVPEHVLVNFLVGSGFNSMLSTLNPPAFMTGPHNGYVWVRFTITDVPITLPWDGSGIFQDGETEDYLLLVGEDNQPKDYGDAPDPPYPTLLSSDGARHVNDGINFLGNLIDTEPDGQPNTNADGDDINNLNDEDGVVFQGLFVPGQHVNVEFTINGNGFISGWFDWDANGSWADPGDHAIVNVPAGTGKMVYSVLVPANAAPGITYARFRFSSFQGFGFDGFAPDGEVEDYAIYIEAVKDFGDAPEGALAYPATGVIGQFPTCKNIGPPGSWIEHASGNAFLGFSWDGEADGNAGFCPSFNPNMYNMDECFEDLTWDAGLIFPHSYTITGNPGAETVVMCPLLNPQHHGLMMGYPCSQAIWGANLEFAVSNNLLSNAYLNVLFDWNQDGVWGGTSDCQGVNVPEHVLVNFVIPAGQNSSLSALLPPAFSIGPNSGYVWARFTISEQPVPLPWDGSGIFDEGETEDYLIRVAEAPPEGDLDFGDAPGPLFATLLADYGACHLIDGITYLGSLVDAEPDGQPHPDALGDDYNGLSDEDGVTFTTLLTPGKQATVKVIASTNCKLNAWIDFDRDWQWITPGEQIFIDQALNQGLNTLNFNVPAWASLGRSFARFRVNQAGGLDYYGYGGAGEVEDYLVFIVNPGDSSKMHWPQLPGTGGCAFEFSNSKLADDFLCTQSGPVNFIRFWIGHQMNNITPTGDFTIEICSDIPAQGFYQFNKPGTVLWSRTLQTGEYAETTMPDDLQCWFTNPPNWSYQHNDHDKWTQITIDNIPDPFIQTRGEIYWLVIKFNSNWQYKGWKTAHWNPVQQTFNWGEILWYDSSTQDWVRWSGDLAFVINNIIPQNLDVQNVTVTGGQNRCFAATQTITTAGGGTGFIVQNGAIVYLVAGQNIIMKEGTHFQSGSYVHAYIDQTGDYCNNPKALIAENDETTKLQEVYNEFGNNEAFFSIFPNPNTGQFTLELRDVTETSTIKVEIFSLIGESIMSVELPEMKQYLFDLSARQPGIYLIRVMKGDDVGVEKVIKQ